MEMAIACHSNVATNLNLNVVNEDVAIRGRIANQVNNP
jgi:hypothetical protein